MHKLVVITGPTASGKSALAMDLARQYDGEIICADSRTVYKGFDIGTAKPSSEDQAQVPHHLLDICEPAELFSAAKFKELAEKAIADIQKRGKLPLLVGGTGLYIDAVVFEYSFQRNFAGDEDGNLHGQFSELSIHELRELVAERGAVVNASDSGNRRRLEQILSKGEVSTNDRNELKKDCIIIALSPEMALLKQNIISRIDVMLSKGFIQEVENLIKIHGHDCPQLDIIGYRHARSFVDGEISIDELKRRFAQDHLSLARRQLTWLRRNDSVQWNTTSAAAKELVHNYLSD